MAHSSQDEGTAIARVLFGEQNPGGHLVVTWPKSIDQLPPMMDYDIRNGRTYMYFKGEPLYPFGFGLSYTTFKISNLKPSATSASPDATLNITVDVTNTGSRGGDEVVQLYVHHLRSAVPRPIEELEGFQRVALDPGETRTVILPLKISNLAYWNDKLSRFVVEKEPLELRISDSSRNILLSTRIQVR
jgi:beta-glucosidase